MIVAEGVTLASGRYELLTQIAIGGMGEVWRAHDAWAQRTVAVKVLRPEFTGDESSLHRLRVEAHNAAMLSHPNIAKVHDYREEDGTGYLVLEYVSGQSLADLLAVQATLEPAKLIPVLHQCALGLFAAHRAGVIHRDVKPGNILLTPAGHVKLTDFGISVCLGQAALTATGKVMGTAQYLAPEQALGRPASPAGDMYALGIIAFESLAGARPFTAGADVDIALAQVRQPPPPLPEWVEPNLRDIVLRLLAKDPKDRPASCAELAHLLTALPGASTEPAPVTTPIEAPSDPSVPAAADAVSPQTLPASPYQEAAAQAVLAPPASSFVPTSPSLALLATPAGPQAVVAVSAAIGQTLARVEVADLTDQPTPPAKPEPLIEPELPAKPDSTLASQGEPPTQPEQNAGALVPAGNPAAPRPHPHRHQMSRRMREAWGLVIVLLCLAAIIAGIVLSGTLTGAQGLQFGNKDITMRAANVLTGPKRGIMSPKPDLVVPPAGRLSERA